MLEHIFLLNRHGSAKDTNIPVRSDALKIKVLLNLRQKNFKSLSLTLFLSLSSSLSASVSFSLSFHISIYLFSFLRHTRNPKLTQLHKLLELFNFILSYFSILHRIQLRKVSLNFFRFQSFKLFFFFLNETFGFTRFV